MPRRQRKIVRTAVLALAAAMAVAGCGAGSKTGAETATQVACGFEKPDKSVDVNVLAYNSSAIDPFTNTMVASCSKNGVTVKHEPIDFGGQVQKTVATLAGDSGTYDIIETYGFVIPQYASEGKIQPLDDLFAKYKDQYNLGEINEAMRQGMSYQGKLYGLPMQAQVHVLAYRKDIFDKLGLQPPKTVDELRSVAKAIQDSGEMKYPLALPMLASADIVTAYDAALGSLGVPMTDPDTMEANFDTPEARQAFEELKSLKPYMDPQVSTFDQPAVQQQLYNGSAAIGWMFSGRMNDLVQQSNTKYFDKFAFAPPPSVKQDGQLFSALSIDGWSIPTNTDLDSDMLFQMIASSVSEKASKASIPAAYPARDGIVTPESSAYAEAATTAIDNSPPAEPYAWTAPISNEITPVVASVFLGKTSVAQGTETMQQIATKILSDYQ
jgi:sorbitol/mannitol transport system substrate-binding protein